MLFIGTDIFGAFTPAAKDLARRLAAGTGGRVIVPDTIAPNGPPMAAFVAEEFPAWLKAHSNDATYELLAKAVAAAKAESPAALLFASGFCWGARQVLDAGKNGLLHGWTVAHPSLTTPEMYTAASKNGVPGLVVRADKDGYDDAAAQASACRVSRVRPVLQSTSADTRRTPTHTLRPSPQRPRRAPRRRTTCPLWGRGRARNTALRFAATTTTRRWGPRSARPSRRWSRLSSASRPRPRQSRCRCSFGR